MSTWPDDCPTCHAPWAVRSKTMGAEHGQPHQGRCQNGHDWFEGQKVRTEPSPGRYVVLVWMHDHWGVTYTSNDEADALRVTELAQKKVKAIFIDTYVWDGVGDS